jgi:hypothetical protein
VTVTVSVLVTVREFSFGHSFFHNSKLLLENERTGLPTASTGVELPVAILALEFEWQLERRHGIERAPGDTRTDICIKWTEPST